MPTRVAVVDDQPTVLSVLSRKISRLPGCIFAGSFEGGQTAIDLMPACQPNVALVDISMPEVDGIACVARLKPLLPQTEFVMLTVYDDSDLVFRALKAGASGYLLKSCTERELHEAIRDVATGGVPMDSAIARKVLAFFHRPSPHEERLSNRENEILQLLADGLLYKEIADRLGLAYSTVNTYVKSIYQKLNVSSRSQAVASYLRQQPISPVPDQKS
jgi:DNA-binding NarL/FixJ family response regulator